MNTSLAVYLVRYLQHSCCKLLWWAIDGTWKPILRRVSMHSSETKLNYPPPKKKKIKKNSYVLRPYWIQNPLTFQKKWPTLSVIYCTLTVPLDSTFNWLSLYTIVPNYTFLLTSTVSHYTPLYISLDQHCTPLYGTISEFTLVRFGEKGEM